MNKLFDVLRIVPVSVDHPVTNESMVKAMTLNENIKSAYGYTFKPENIVKIAKSDTDVWAFISDAIPEIKGRPMYPDFPSQVMDMDEATYRFHQMVNYFSTYGIEALFGVQTKTAWVPDVDETEKIKEDKSLFEVKVIEAVEEDKLPFIVVSKIAARKQRMTPDERCLVAEYALQLPSDEWKNIKISFKENLCDIFLAVVDSVSREAAKNIMTILCQHTGDVLKCVKFYLGKHRYKLSTSQKKLFVKILESFPASDFKANIMRSNLNREDVLTTLQYLDYNTFSRSSEHKVLVAELRNKGLKSWYADLETAFKTDIKKATSMLADRPGEFLRRLNVALNNGITKETILDTLDAGSLSLSTLVRLNTFFWSNEADERFAKNKFDISTIVRRLIYTYLTGVNSPIKDKKVFVEEGAFDFNASTIEVNDRSEMSGYIRSGIAYKIPEEAKVIRFFTYWNDADRVDVDLHAKAVKGDTVDHIGWNSNYKNNGMLMSGDMTDSDSAEFIDVDLNSCDADYVLLQIQDYTRKGFDNIDEVLCGVMAVSEMGLENDVKLYTPKNCFFANEINMKTTDLQYGYIDLKNRTVRFIGKTGRLDAMANSVDEIPVSDFSLNSYLDTFFAAQNVTRVEKREDADVVLRLDKGMEENNISLIDENFFLEI